MEHIKKYEGTYQEVSMRAQNENLHILTLQEIIELQLKTTKFKGEFMTASAVLINPFKKEIKLSKNFTNDQIITFYNLDKNAAKILYKTYEDTLGDTLSIQEFKEHKGIKQHHTDLIQNPILLGFIEPKLLKKYIDKNAFQTYNLALNINLKLPKSDMTIHALPIGINQNEIFSEYHQKKIYLIKSNINIEEKSDNA